MSALEESINLCRNCSLHNGRTYVVPGCGHISPRLFIIGEAPGANEDSVGYPFVGAAGKMLTKMLESIDIQRDQTFITNVVKCRPPENRRPTSKEIDNCALWLRMQIQETMPDTILLLGKSACNGFLDFDDSDFTMKELRETSPKKIRFNPYNNPNLFLEIYVFITYHPSYLLRNPEAKKLAYHDLQKLKKHLDTLYSR